MEKFFLGTFLTDDKLDIINEEHIVIAVLFPEFRGGYVVFVTDGIDQLIGKGLRCDVKDLGIGVVF